ncbi:hypothetical protein RSOL_179460 [Rhizoctonia solani AG-3 Rhs1AP]|uniref:Ricin-type beta-trefoil lectin domain protein n=2 Tax=Rhizoctonia solani AG-3 TaxID=1086053 RepID=A0A074RV95_9AGAM|nr:hypothetical protein RSOL_179460 [Rhizoctonia solani AG-3 Rhs1AP]KEP50824.1 hypothetical protein V565_072850 [Rhizoctonia solani 123E]
MSTIEPGIYRIISKLNGKVITIPTNNPGTISGAAPKLQNQKWIIRRSGDYYQFEDCLYGKSIAPDNTSYGTRVNLECYPANWEIIPSGANEYLIKFVGHDLVLDLHANDEVHCWSANGVPQRLWSFERLSGLTGNIPENGSSPIISMKNGLIAHLTEQLKQKDDQLTARDQAIQEQMMAIEQGAKELTRMREELNIANARLAERKDCNEATSSALSSNSTQNEVALLRERLDRLESLLEIGKRPNT